MTGRANDKRPRRVMTAEKAMNLDFVSSFLIAETLCFCIVLAEQSAALLDALCT